MKDMMNKKSYNTRKYEACHVPSVRLLHEMYTSHEDNVTEELQFGHLLTQVGTETPISFIDDITKPKSKTKCKKVSTKQGRLTI